ncbi:unnamed protein product [Allacma fusca]|uniref:Secreted peptide n=1 Tax=Allacma fusca TaxID=39272 RepID=A0A8J2NKU7_9HEXA|nr:unnamed protein product [Allacma fusca]
MDVAAVVLILLPVPPIGAAIWGPRTMGMVAVTVEMVVANVEIVTVVVTVTVMAVVTVEIVEIVEIVAN